MKSVVLVWWRKEGGTAMEMLNKWLAENNNKIIKIVSQSEGGTVAANYRITYTIFYEEA